MSILANTSEDVFREGILLIIRLNGPILILSMIVGVVTAILQAVTSIHEQSIAFVMKMIVVIAFLVFGGSWMLRSLQEFSLGLFDLMLDA